MKRTPAALLVFLLCCLFATSLLAQTAPPASPAPPVIQRDYSQEPSVVELSSTKISFQDDGTSIRTLTSRIRVQNGTGVQQWGMLEFPFESATQTVDIDYVRVLKADGTVVATPPDNIQDLDAEITRSAPFYSDLRVKHVAVKGLSTGDVLEVQAHWNTTKPLVAGQFWFDDAFNHASVVLNESLEVSIPSDRPVKVEGPRSEER